MSAFAVELLDLEEELVFEDALFSLLVVAASELDGATELDSGVVSLDSGEALLSLLTMAVAELDDAAELDSGVVPELLELSSPQAARHAVVTKNRLNRNCLVVITSPYSTIYNNCGWETSILRLMKQFKSLLVIVCAVIMVAGAKVSAAQYNEDIKIVKVNDSNFELEVLQSKKPVILEISSTSCPPCLIMIPTLIGIAKNYSDIKIATVGIDEPGIDKIKASLPIQAFPTFFLIRDGKIVNKLVGAVKEEELLNALQYTPSKKAAKPAKAGKAKNSPKNLVCKTNGQFNGLKNMVTISFVFGAAEIENVDIVTDVFVPPELGDRREQMIEHVRASGKGEVEPTMTGFRMHIDNDCRFMKAMDMKRTSTYGEMRAGLELQGFNCQ